MAVNERERQPLNFVQLEHMNHFPIQDRESPISLRQRKGCILIAKSWVASEVWHFQWLPFALCTFLIQRKILDRGAALTSGTASVDRFLRLTPPHATTRRTPKGNHHREYGVQLAPPMYWRRVRGGCQSRRPNGLLKLAQVQHG